MNKLTLITIIYTIGIIIGALFLDVWGAETTLIKTMSIFIWTILFLIALFYVEKDKNEQMLSQLNRSIIKCNKCSRLVKFRNKLAKNKRKQYLDQEYWAKPITGFGDISGKILFVGLAPAAHGGTRTGRVFTGDKSSDFLYKCLYKANISNQPTSTDINDGLKLKNAYI